MSDNQIDTGTETGPMTGKPLLERVHLDAAGFASNAEWRGGRMSLHVKPDGTVVATNGHLLVQVGPSRIPQEDGPESGSDGIGANGVNLTADCVKAAARMIPKRSSVPVGSAVQVTPGSLTVPLVGTIRAETEERAFPAYESVILDPTPETHVTVGFNAGYLVDLMKYAEKYAKGLDTVVTCHFPRDANKPARFDFETEAGVKVAMVLMPVRP